MKLKIFHYRQLLILGIALGFLFFGWNAAEQHLTSFYQASEGQTTTGLNALAILYTSIIIGNFLGPILVRKLGLKTSIIFGFITYILLVFGVISKIDPLIYLLSALLGIGSGVMGVAQIDFIRIFSPKNSRGELAGSINALRTIGGSLGVLSVSLLLNLLKIENIYIILGAIMTVGVATLFWLEEPVKSISGQSEAVQQTIRKTLSMFRNPKILLTLPTITAEGFLLGLVLAAIPTSITQTYGIQYVGLIMAFFHFNLSYAGLLSGKISDRQGRFPTLYLALLTWVVAAFLTIIGKNILILVMAMALAGFSSATIGGAVMPALFIDMFDKKVKEAQAASGIATTILGIVPAFILNKYFTTNQLLYLAIFLCFLGGVFLRILEEKMSNS